MQDLFLMFPYFIDSFFLFDKARNLFVDAHYEQFEHLHKSPQCDFYFQRENGFSRT